MTPMFKTAAAAALLCWGLAAALPSRAATGDEGGRYSMSPTDGGFVRLDRQTGAMTFCSKADANWSCTPMGDSQQAASSEIERLENENKALKADKKHLEEMLGMADPSAPGATPPGPGAASPPMKIPSEQDVDQAFDYIEGMVKKFRERIKKLESENQPGQQL